MSKRTKVTLYLASLLLCLVKQAMAIGCFVCTSLNHRNPDCEDTFNNTASFYKADCLAPRQGRVGDFPATQCIKMTAEDEKKNFTLIVRDCVVDNGGTNTETEIGRQSHCGWMRQIKYNNIRRSGCILSCNTDGCNTANHAFVAMHTLFIATLTGLTLNTIR